MNTGRRPTLSVRVANSGIVIIVANAAITTAVRIVPLLTFRYFVAYERLNTEKIKNDPFSANRAPIASRTDFLLCLSTSSPGNFLTSPFSAISEKTGVSSIAIRINIPTTTKTMLMRKGQRQPQLSNASGDIEVKRAITPVESTSPAGTPSWGHALLRPRWWSGECSTTIKTAPPHSPPSAKPCAIRITIRSIGAQIPIWLYVGRRPIRKVATPIIVNVATRTALRPRRSPKWPKMIPPRGRATKPTANVPNAAMVPARGLDWGKNNLPKTRAAAAP